MVKRVRRQKKKEIHPIGGEGGSHQGVVIQSRPELIPSHEFPFMCMCLFVFVCVCLFVNCGYLNLCRGERGELCMHVSYSEDK